MCWRNNLNSIHKRMEAVMNTNIPDIPHDVTLVVGEEQVKISCHKIFLAIASPVFQAMFSGHYDDKSAMEVPSGFEITKSEVNVTESSLKGKESNRETVINITDLQPIGFKNIVKYAYTGKMDVGVKDALATMYAADKYDIPELTQYCSQLLYSDIRIENAVTIYQAAVFLNDNKLEEKSFKFIESNSAELLEYDEFLEFSEESLYNFLKFAKMPYLKSEADVFNAVLRWGNRECERKGIMQTPENIRIALTKVLPLIRFPVMNPCEFNAFVQPSGILSAEECISLYTYFTESEEKRLLLAETMKYSCKGRGPLFVVSLCSVPTNDRLQTHASGCYDTFIVSGNTENIKLKALGVVLPQNTGPLSHKPVTIGLWDVSAQIWAASTTTMVSKFMEVCYIDFDDIVTIKPNVVYQACISFDGRSPNSMVQYPATVLRYSGELMNASIVKLKTADNHITVHFTTVHQVIWGLQFE